MGRAGARNGTRPWSVRDPGFEFRYVNAERTLQPRADEAARARPAITRHAFDLHLRLLAPRTLMLRWRGDLLTRHDRPPAGNGMNGISEGLRRPRMPIGYDDCSCFSEPLAVRPSPHQSLLREGRMEIDVPAAGPPLQPRPVTTEPESADFDQRWASWQAKGRPRSRRPSEDRGCCADSDHCRGCHHLHAAGTVTVPSGALCTHRI